MKISIVIPNYNGEELLRKNLSSVIDAANYYKEKTNNDIEIIIVDDFSTDNSIGEIQNSIPPFIPGKELRIIFNKNNMGFSSTVNKGVEEAKGEIVVLLNTDVQPKKDFLLKLIEHFEKDEKVFAVGCLDESIEKGKTIFRGRGIGQWKRGFLVHKKGKVDRTNTLWVSGGSGAFRKSIWEKLGGFNKLYNPFYWEDIDLSYRALKTGYKLIFESKSIVIHMHEEGIIKRKYSSFEIKNISYRNQFIFVWENMTDIYLKFSHIIWLPYHFLNALKRLDFAFFLGFIKALLLLPQVVKSKARFNKHFILKDKEIIKNFLE